MSSQAAADRTYAYLYHEVEIVAAVPDDTDPHPTCDWFRIRFVDGHEMEVAPEELDPIPPVGFGRKTNR